MASPLDASPPAGLLSGQRVELSPSLPPASGLVVFMQLNFPCRLRLSRPLLSAFPPMSLFAPREAMKVFPDIVDASYHMLESGHGYLLWNETTFH